MIDPTYEEWQAARERVLALWPHNAPGYTHWDKVVEAALGCPCPPKPAPRCGRQIGSLRWACRRPDNHPDACRPNLMPGDPPTEHVRRYVREQQKGDGPHRVAGDDE
jgi:hypothetical protein